MYVWVYQRVVFLVGIQNSVVEKEGLHFVFEWDIPSRYSINVKIEILLIVKLGENLEPKISGEKINEWIIRYVEVTKMGTTYEIFKFDEKNFSVYKRLDLLKEFIKKKRAALTKIPRM